MGVTVTEVAEGSGGFEPGLYISEIEDGSAAQKANLHAFDRIIEFNSVKIKGYNDLSAELSELKAGDTVKIKVIRNEEELELDITLQESSAPKRRK